MTVVTNGAAVSVQDISKEFTPSPGWLRVLIKSPLDKPIQALRSVSFEVPQGEVCALVGPNGAGKTTLFNILIGLTTPTSGTASVLGLDVVTDSLAIRRRIGWMATSAESLFQRHTVAENLRFHGRVYGLSGAKLEGAIDETLEIVELSHVKDNAVASLSSGMNARLRLARALLHRPSLLLLDEPTATVDPVASLFLVELVRSIVKDLGIAAIMSSHRLDEIEALHSHVLLLHRGRVLFDGDLEELRPQLDRTRYVVDFTDMTSATSAKGSLEQDSRLEQIESSGTSIEMTLKPEVPLGGVLTSLGARAADVVSARRVERPLRSILAEVYGEADRNEP